MVNLAANTWSENVRKQIFSTATVLSALETCEARQWTICRDMNHCSYKMKAFGVFKRSEGDWGGMIRMWDAGNESAWGRGHAYKNDKTKNKLLTAPPRYAGKNLFFWLNRKVYLLEKRRTDGQTREQGEEERGNGESALPIILQVFLRRIYRLEQMFIEPTTSSFMQSVRTVHNPNVLRCNTAYFPRKLQQP